jgi:hypothetical protein
MTPAPKRRRPVVLLTAGLCLLVAQTALANDKFAGSWKLDRMEAHPGREPVEIEMTIAVEGKDLLVDGIVTRRDSEPEKYSFRYITDGKPHEVPGDGDEPRLASAKWKGSKLAVEFMTERKGAKVEVKETWRIKKGELVIQLKSPPPPPESKDWVVKQYFVRQ